MASECLFSGRYISRVDIQDHRRARLATWVIGRGGHTAVVRDQKLTTSQASYLSQVINGYSFAERAARSMEARLGMPKGYLDQEGANQAGAKPPPGGPVEPPVAHGLTQLKRDDAPIQIEWESILKAPLKKEFQTAMPDASMEPDIPRGAGVIFVTGLQAAPGDWVLTRDRDGALFVRELRQVKPGRWEAHALNPAFLPMDSERDGLEVLAVFDGLRGRKARV